MWRCPQPALVPGPDSMAENQDWLLFSSVGTCPAGPAARGQRPTVVHKTQPARGVCLGGSGQRRGTCHGGEEDGEDCYIQNPR